MLDAFNSCHSNWWERVIKDITIDIVYSDNIVLCKVRVNNTKIEALYDTGTSVSIMSHQCFNTLENKLKLMKGNRYISGAGAGKPIPVGECFIQLEIRNNIFKDKVIIIEILPRDYTLGQVLHKANWFGTGYSTNGKHYITLKGEMFAQSCLWIVTNPILENKGKIKLLPFSYRGHDTGDAILQQHLWAWF